MDTRKMPPNPDLARLYKLALDRSSEGNRQESFELFSACLDHPAATDLFRAIVLFLLSLDFKASGLQFTHAGMHLLKQYGRKHPDQIDAEFNEAERDARDLLKFHQREAARRAAAKKAALKTGAGVEASSSVDSDDGDNVGDNDDNGLGHGIGIGNGDDGLDLESPMQKLTIGTEIEGPAKGNVAGKMNNAVVIGRG